SPFGLDDAVTIVRHKLGGIGAVCTMDLDAVVYRDKAKHVVAGYGVAARRKCIIDFLQIVSNQQRFVVFLIDLLNQSTDMRIKLLAVLLFGCLFAMSKILEVLYVNFTLRNIVEQILR